MRSQTPQIDARFEDRRSDRHFRISSARACSVASGSPASNSHVAAACGSMQQIRPSGINFSTSGRRPPSGLMHRNKRRTGCTGLLNHLVGEQRDREG